MVVTAVVVMVITLMALAAVGGYLVGHSTTSAPSAPVLLSPAEGTSFDVFPRTTEVTWEPVSRARTYLIEVQYYDGGTARFEPAPGKNGTVPAAQTTYVFTFIGKQAGRWRVTAVDDDGVGGPPSAWRTFAYQR